MTDNVLIWLPIRCFSRQTKESNAAVKRSDESCGNLWLLWEVLVSCFSSRWRCWPNISSTFFFLLPFPALRNMAQWTLSWNPLQGIWRLNVSAILLYSVGWGAKSQTKNTQRTAAWNNERLSVGNCKKENKNLQFLSACWMQTDTNGCTKHSWMTLSTLMKMHVVETVLSSHMEKLTSAVLGEYPRAEHMTQE